MNTLKEKAVLVLLACSVSACGLINNKHSHDMAQIIDTSKLSNDIIKTAIKAWQKGDSNLWLSFFTNDAELLDDGHPGDFVKFSTEAIGHERFTSIDKVEDNGMNIFGRFHSDTWGDFKTYFKFHINNEGKIDKLEIGQADY
jgi:hypothetical protein